MGSDDNYTSPHNSKSMNVIRFDLESHSPSLVILVVLFFCILLLTAFFFFRFVYLHRNATTTTTLPVVVPAIQLGLDAAAINSIPIILHGPTLLGGNNNNVHIKRDRKEECSICLGMFEDGEKVKVLPECLHAYHSDCVDKWLKHRSSCPLCRSSLDSTATDH